MKNVFKNISNYYVLGVFLSGLFLALVSTQKTNAQSIATPIGFLPATSTNQNYTVSGACAAGNYPQATIQSTGNGGVHFNQAQIYFDTWVMPAISISGNPNDNLVFSVLNNGGQQIASTTLTPQQIITNTINGTTFVNFTPIFITSTGTPYGFGISRSTNSGSGSYGIPIFFRGSSTGLATFYADEGFGCQTNGGIASPNGNNQADMVGTMYGSTNAGNISFLSPLNGQTGSDFSQWAVSLAPITGNNLTHPEIGILYGSSSSTLIYSDSIFLPNTNGNVDTTLTKSRALSNGTWYAQAVIIDDLGNIYAQSQTISFNVSSTASSFGSQITNYNINPSSTATFGVNTWCPNPAFSLNPLSYVGYGLCQAINFAFNPNVFPLGQSFFYDQLNNLKKVPPFVAFYTITSSTQNALNNFSNSTTTGVSIGILGFNGEQRNLVTINASSVFGGFSGSNNSSTDQNTFNFLSGYFTNWLWIGAGIKILYIFLT